MIVTKQRRQSHSSYQSNQNHNYTYSLFQQDKENHFKSTNQSKTRVSDKQAPCYDRQRNYMSGSVSKASNAKNSNYFTPYQSSKKAQKKYDYSVVFEQQQHDKQAIMSQTHSKINSRFSHEKRNTAHTNEKPQLSFIADDRKRCSSLKSSIPKYRYTENNYMLIQQRQEENQPKSNTKLVTSYKKDGNGNNQSKVNQGAGYTTAANLIANKPSRYQPYQSVANKENRASNTKVFFANDNFSYQNKFIQAKTHQKLADPKSSSKYEQKYSRMRASNRRSQIMNKNYQCLQNQPPATQQQQCLYKEAAITLDTRPSVDFEQLYKTSQTDNKKLAEKINRITQLNGEINRRLQKMLLSKNLH